MDLHPGQTYAPAHRRGAAAAPLHRGGIERSQLGRAVLAQRAGQLFRWAVAAPPPPPGPVPVAFTRPAKAHAAAPECGPPAPIHLAPFSPACWMPVESKVYGNRPHACGSRACSMLDAKKRLGEIARRSRAATKSGPPSRKLGRQTRRGPIQGQRCSADPRTFYSFVEQTPAGTVHRNGAATHSMPRGTRWYSLAVR